MALSYKTPGVYLEEVTKLPPSVASVETAIPCFFGATEKIPDSFDVGKAKKISSMVEYEQFFGGPKELAVTVTIKQNLPAVASTPSPYVDNLYYAVKHYFDNGGGPCYVCAVAAYGGALTATDYENALSVLPLADEVSLILAPDLVRLADADKYYGFYNKALLQSADLKDKFVVIDVRNESSANLSKNVFRDKISNTPEAIKYGAAYFPNLVTTYSFDFNRANITLNFELSLLTNVAYAPYLNNVNYRIAKRMSTLYNLLSYFNDDYFKAIKKDGVGQKLADIRDKLQTGFYIFDAAPQQVLLDWLKKLGTQMEAKAAAAPAANASFDYADSAAKEKEGLLKVLSDKAVSEFGTLPAATITALKLPALGVDDSSYATLSNTFLSKIAPFFNSTFESQMKEAFLAIPVELPPSAAVCGLYAFVDRTRGVWKAPANVSVNNVVKPSIFISDAEQADFNVDAENGKSINCIRNFVGRGTLVWGARTIAGNNNEWKYVNVRRFFNMVEESVENAIRQFVFEPNDANTWVRVKGMIDNYLTNLWREGALQGVKPEHAFYTAVGLNQTMTSVDILEGRLIVEVGLAVVRPAEFIILRFSHKLAVS